MGESGGELAGAGWEEAGVGEGTMQCTVPLHKRITKTLLRHAKHGVHGAGNGASHAHCSMPGTGKSEAPRELPP